MYLYKTDVSSITHVHCRLNIFRKLSAQRGSITVTHTFIHTLIKEAICTDTVYMPTRCRRGRTLQMC